MITKERRSMKTKSNSYVLIYGILFRRNIDDMLLIFPSLSKSIGLIKEIHKGVFGGHFYPMLTSHRIIQDGFYWKTLFRGVQKFLGS
jgi:hypothetical protein